MLLIFLLGFAPILMLLTLALALYLTVIELRELNPHAPDNELIRTDGLKLGEIFGLPLHWPNGPE